MIISNEAAEGARIDATAAFGRQRASPGPVPPQAGPSTLASHTKAEPEGQPFGSPTARSEPYSSRFTPQLTASPTAHGTADSNQSQRWPAGGRPPGLTQRATPKLPKAASSLDRLGVG